jgi:hypothetical protein
LSTHPHIEFQIKPSSSEKGRDVFEVVLESPGTELRPTHLLISGPAGFNNSEQRLPVMFISSGFTSGMKTISLIPNPREWILIGYEYPTSFDQIADDLSQIPKSFRQVPGQLSLALLWISGQAWTSCDDLVYMNVSLGTLFAPISLAMAQDAGVRVSRTVFAFGGSEISPVLTNGLKDKIPEANIRMIAQLADTLTVLHDPKLHLPDLLGQFLVIRGEFDQVFPYESSQTLEQLLPMPKEIRVVSAPHIEPDRSDIIEQTMNEVLDWLGK